MTTNALDPFSTFIHLRAGGEAMPMTWTPTFWRDLQSGAEDRVVGAHHGRDANAFHPSECEMHPSGDELLYLLSGAVDVILEEPAGDRTIALRGGQACLVPRGVWHRLRLREPGDLLFVTPPSGTRLRPARATIG